MIDSEEVTGFSVQSVNFGIFTALSLKITNFLADIGFDMYAAIECILKVCAQEYKLKNRQTGSNL